MTTEIQVIVTSFDAAREDITHVRDSVFVHEQNIPAEEEYDQYDPVCTHVVLRCDGGPVATGRLIIEPTEQLEVQGQVAGHADHHATAEPTGRFGRIAVLAGYRGRGLGQRLVIELERLARAAGLSSIWFHAQTYAQPFYERLGYQASGAEFIEDGIPHVYMSKRL